MTSNYPAGQENIDDLKEPTEDMDEDLEFERSRDMEEELRREREEQE